MNRTQAFGLLAAALFIAVAAWMGINHHQATKRGDFNAWSKTQQGKIEAYAAFLQAHGVYSVLPMEQLLVSARDAMKCASLRYEVPPNKRWNDVLPTLRLIQQLKERGLIKPRAATSGYRSSASNHCSNGARGSMHLHNNAIDLDIDGSGETAARLCEFWRTQGGALHFGLGFYEKTAIHIDTAGHRTWGYDYSPKTSLCNTR